MTYPELPHFVTPFQAVSDTPLPVNLNPNPSFEYDLVGAFPAGYTAPSMAVAPVTMDVENGWSSQGNQSFRITSGSHGPNQQDGVWLNGPVNVPVLNRPGWPVTPGDTWTLSADFNVLARTGSPYVYMEYWWYSSTGSFISAATGPTNVAAAVGVTKNSYNTKTVPAGAAYLAVSITWGSPTATTSTVDFYVDGISLTNAPAYYGYNDGDDAGWLWSGTPGNSSSAQEVVVAVNEQDTEQEIMGCEFVIVSYPVGFRDDRPEFGWAWPEMVQAPLATADLVEALKEFEPRAPVRIEEVYDAAMATVTLNTYVGIASDSEES